MGILHEIALRCQTDKATFHKYCDFYEANLPDRNFSGRLLEIGIMDGNSLRMWAEYYPNMEIIGIDVNIPAKSVDRVAMIKMDGTNADELSSLGMFDIIIDDASHMTKDQQTTFNHLYKHQLNKGGLYICEDLHTSFMPTYINTPKTTYDILKKKKGMIEYNGNEGQSITMIIKK